jgi:hypothetical protein
MEVSVTQILRHLFTISLDPPGIRESVDNSTSLIENVLSCSHELIDLGRCLRARQIPVGLCRQILYFRKATDIL